MNQRIRLHPALLALSVALVACGAAQPAPTVAPPATEPPTPAPPTALPATLPPTVGAPTVGATTVSAPTAAAATELPPTEAPAAEALYMGLPHGVTPEGFFYLGQVDAPVTVYDYSDFL